MIRLIIFLLLAGCNNPTGSDIETLNGRVFAIQRDIDPFGDLYMSITSIWIFREDTFRTEEWALDRVGDWGIPSHIEMVLWANGRYRWNDGVWELTREGGEQWSRVNQAMVPLDQKILPDAKLRDWGDIVDWGGAQYKSMSFEDYEAGEYNVSAR